MKNKSRKSKKLLVVVAVILMLGLVVGMGAMTYSRYVTSGSTGPKKATAAKWGFVVTVSADDLFASDYTKGENASLATKATSSGVAVHASTKVVAPGTTGSMTITINGSAEVLAQLSITTTGTASEIHLGDDYYPVKWTLTEKSETAPIVNEGKLSDVITNLTGTSTTFEAGTSYKKEYTLTWKWDFGSGDETNAKDTLIGYKADGKTYDAIKDTYVGSKLLSEVVKDASAYSAIVTEMSFNLTISVEQIQTKPTN